MLKVLKHLLSARHVIPTAVLLIAPCVEMQYSPALPNLQWVWSRALLSCASGSLDTRAAQNAQGVVKDVIKGATRASFGRRAPLTPQLKRASARRREEKDFRGVYKIQQVAAVHLGWGQTPSLETENDIRLHSMGAT